MIWQYLGWIDDKKPLPRLMRKLEDTELDPGEPGFFAAARSAVIDMGIVRRKKQDVAADIPARRIADIPVELDGESGRSIREAEAALVARLVERYRRLARSRAPTARRTTSSAWSRRPSSRTRRAPRPATTCSRWCAASARRRRRPAADYTVNLARNVGKVVFFAKHIDVMDAAEAHFAAAGLKTVSIRGEQTAKARTAAIDAFTNDPDVAVAVCSLMTAGVGINLQVASNVVLAELSWTNAEQTQAIDRVHRIGQELPVTAWRIIAAGTIDGRISELIDSKAGPRGTRSRRRGRRSRRRPDRCSWRRCDAADDAAASSSARRTNLQLSSETSRLAGVVHLPVTSTSLRGASPEVTEGPSGLDEPPGAARRNAESGALRYVPLFPYFASIQASAARPVSPVRVVPRSSSFVSPSVRTPAMGADTERRQPG